MHEFEGKIRAIKIMEIVVRMTARRRWFSSSAEIQIRIGNSSHPHTDFCVWDRKG